MLNCESSQDVVATEKVVESLTNSYKFSGIASEKPERIVNRPLQKAVSGYSPPQMTAMSMIPQHRPSTTMTTAK